MASKLNVRGTRGQDKAAAQAELKQFRHDVSILRKKGILDKSLYDARKVKPTKYLKSQIKKFASVLSGESKPVKVSKKKAAYYKRKGYEVKNLRVIVPAQANQKVYSTHGDFRVKTYGKGGSITQIDIGFDKHDIAKWLDDLRNSRIKLGPDEQLMFQFNGYNSTQGYDRPTKYDKNGNVVYDPKAPSAQERMANRLMQYALVEDTLDGRYPDEETIDSIVVYRVERNAWPAPDTSRHVKDEESRRRYNEWAARRREIRLGEMSDKRRAEFFDEKAAAEKKRRANLTDEQKAAYREKARKRAAASRAKKKGK